MTPYAATVASFAVLAAIVWRYRRTPTLSAAAPLVTAISSTPRGLLEGEPVDSSTVALYFALCAVAIGFSVIDATWVRGTPRPLRLAFAGVWLCVSTGLLVVLGSRVVSDYRLVFLVILHVVSIVHLTRRGLQGGAEPVS